MQDMERPLYMQPKDAISYNVCDGIVRPRTAIIDEVKKAEAWCAACLNARVHSAWTAQVFVFETLHRQHAPPLHTRAGVAVFSAAVAHQALGHAVFCGTRMDSHMCRR